MTEHDTFWLLPEEQRVAIIGMSRQLMRKLEIEYGEAFDLLRQCGYFVVQIDRKRKKLDELHGQGSGLSSNSRIAHRGG